MCILHFACFLLPASAATYTVSSLSELNSRISSAVAGDTIIVQNGVYSSSAAITITRAGTAANPITIRAETIGGVEITGTKGFVLNSGAAYVVIQGFVFTHSGNISISSGTSHCRFTRNLIQLAIPAGSDVSYINISGDDVEIDRNELCNKSTLGEMLDIAGSGSQVARRLWVHHNYFHDFVSPGGNGAETIRWGLSGLSLSTGNGLCEYNLFVRCNGENEMISNKSSGNTYRYNTVLDCPGGEISQRHGNDCLYYGNYMRNTQGMRIYGDRHRIFSNYLEGNSVGVNMGNGDGDIYNGAPLTAHDRPDDNVVVYNTFVNNTTHYEMAGRTGGLGSSNTVVANNIFQGGSTMASISSSAPYTGTWSNNIRWSVTSAGNMPASGYLTVNPLLAPDATGVNHLQAGSPAINAGRGSFDYYGVFSSYPYVTSDLDGQTRDASKDIGADEYSTAPVIARLLTTNDVGPNSMAGDFQIAAVPGSQSVPVGIATNLNYSVTVTNLVGASPNVSLSVGGLPDGVIATLTPTSVAGSGTSALAVAVSNTAAPGNYVLSITGTSPDSTNTTSVGLLLLRPPANLRWSGTGSGAWDIAATANWFNLDASASDLFLPGDTVLFDDAAAVQTNVTITGAVTPAAMTNDSSVNNFAFGGPGRISGAGGIVKRGTSVLTLSSVNDFTGTVLVQGGTLRIGSSYALGDTNGVTVIASGATLDLNGIALSGVGEYIVVSGAGADGNGAIYNSGAQRTDALRYVTLAGDTTFGGGTRSWLTTNGGRWDIRASGSSRAFLSTGGQPCKLTKTGSNQVSFVAADVDPNLGEIDIQQGLLGFETTTTSMGNPASNLTVRAGATLSFYQSTNRWNKSFVLYGDGVTASVTNWNGTNVMAGPATLNGPCVFGVGGPNGPVLVCAGPLGGNGGLIKNGIAAGRLLLTATNTYSGDTTIRTGTLALSGDGSIAASGTLSISAGATLDVSGRTDGTLTLASGQTLTGNGTVNGSVTVGPGATVSPGFGIGVLTVTNEVTLDGTTFLELSAADGTNDMIRGAAAIQYGGTLWLTNLAGLLTTNDSFKLFDAASYSGAFTDIQPSVAGVGLAWDASTLAVDGTLGFRAFVPPGIPWITDVFGSGADVVIRGTNGPTNGIYFLLMTTNMTWPRSNWAVVATNVFDGDGNFSFTNALDFSRRGHFFILQVP